VPLENVPHIIMSPLSPSSHDAFPSDRHGLEEYMTVDLPKEGEKLPFPLTYGAYLRAIKSFLLGHWDLFLEAVSHQTSSGTHSIDEIAIIAAKHGSDYHPARVVARIGDSHRPGKH